MKAVVFDLDDTLYLESDYVASGYRAVASHLERKYGWPAEEWFSKMIRVFATQGRAEVFPAVLNGAPRPFPSLEEMVGVYRAHRPRIRLLPGYLGLLSGLRRSYRLGLITDGLAHVQRSKVRALGLERAMDSIIYTRDFGTAREKPNPFAFRLMLRRLGTVPGESVYVGDNPDKDRAGAQAAGMRFVQVASERNRWSRCGARRGGPPEFRVDSLHALPQVLERIH